MAAGSSTRAGGVDSLKKIMNPMKQATTSPTTTRAFGPFLVGLSSRWKIGWRGGFDGGDVGGGEGALPRAAEKEGSG
jgi:hypothetical protein